MSLEDLLNQEQQIPDGWRPNDGDQLVGKVTQVTTGWSDQSESNYPILVIHDENKDEDVSIHCFHHVLKNAVLKTKPQIGERIGVKLTGEVPLKSNPNRSVKTYNFVVEGRGADYSAFSDNPSSSSNNPASPDSGQVIADEGEDTPF